MPRIIPSDIINVNDRKTYIEYRNGLFRGITEGLGKATFGNNEKVQKFSELIKSSKDIYSLLIDTSIIKTIDEMDGIIKVLLTIGSKWFEANYSLT